MNLPYVTTVTKHVRYIAGSLVCEPVTITCVVTSATTLEDGFKGSHYCNYDSTGKCVGRGYSKGWNKDGWGSAVMAMKNARRAAARHIHNIDKEYDK